MGFSITPLPASPLSTCPADSGSFLAVANGAKSYDRHQRCFRHRLPRDPSLAEKRRPARTGTTNHVSFLKRFEVPSLCAKSMLTERSSNATYLASFTPALASTTRLVLYNNEAKSAFPAMRGAVTLLGTGSPRHKDRPGLSAEFDEPGGLSIAYRKLCIADTNNHATRTADLESSEVATLVMNGI